MRRLLLAALLLVTVTGCGPDHSVSLGVRDVTTDILLTKGTPTAAPVAVPPTIPPGFPFVPPAVPLPTGQLPTYLPLPPAPSQAPPTPVAACPEAGVYATASEVAPSTPTGAPRPGSYPVRVDGSYALTGSVRATGAYGPAGSRTIANVAQLPGGVGWSYDITDEGHLTTSYQVIPKKPADPAPTSSDQPVPTQPGIYVTAFVYERADGTELSLRPNPALLVAQLPFGATTKWTSHSTDASAGVAITLNGQVGLGERFEPVKDRIDACGTVLDAYWVEYTVDTTPLGDPSNNPEPPSQITGPTLTVQFVGSRVAFGPQYGGIPLEEHYRLKGNDAGTGIDITRHAIYSVEPAVVKAAS